MARFSFETTAQGGIAARELKDEYDEGSFLAGIEITDELSDQEVLQYDADENVWVAQLIDNYQVNKAQFIAGTNVSIDADDNAKTLTINAASSGAMIAVEDDGTQVSSAVDIFNFESLINATDDGTEIDISLDSTVMTEGENVSLLNNDAGYITNYTVTQSDVTQHEGALTITESQISDLDHYTTSDFDTDFGNQDTDDLSEGSTNLYYTQSRFDSDFNAKTTDDLGEGSVNQYFTDERAQDAVGTILGSNFNYDDATPSITLTNDSVTVTAGDGLQNGGSVSLGSSTTLDIDVSDFAGSGLQDDGSENLELVNDSVTVTAGDGLKNGGNVSLGASTTLDIEPADFAGNGLVDDGADDLELDVAVADDGSDVATTTSIYELNFGSSLTITDNTGTTPGRVTVDVNTTSATSIDVDDDGADVATGVNNLNFGTNLDVTDDGSGAVTIDGANTQLSDEEVQDAVYTNVLSGTQTLITVTYDDPNNEVDYVVNDDLSQYDNSTSGFISNLSGFTTDDLTEGSTNLYFTDERVDDRVNNLLQAGSNITLGYDDGANTLTVSSTDTDTNLSDEEVQDAVYNNVLSGTQTLISVSYDDANNEVDYTVNDDLSLYDNSTSGFTTYDTTNFNTDFGNQTTDDLSEGTANLYYLDSRVDSLISGGTGVTTSFTQNDPASGTLTVNSNLTPFTTDDLGEGSTNLYFTDERAQDAALGNVTGNQGITWTYNDGSNNADVTLSNLNSFDTDDLSEGSSNLYFTDTRAVNAVESEAVLNLNEIDVSNSSTFQQNLTVQGDLTVNGDQFITNTETVEIEDTLGIVNFGETGAGVSSASGFAGWEVDRGSANPFLWIYDEATDLPKFGEYYKEVTYSGLSGGFQFNEAVIGGTSGARGIIFNDTGSVLSLKGNFGAFSVGEQITGQTSGATATVDSINVVSDLFTELGREDNPVDRAVFVWDDTSGRAVTSTDLTFSGTELSVTDINVSGTVTGIDTDDITEGTGNLYFTDERAQDAAAAMITGGTNITTNYDDGTNTFTINTTDVTIDFLEDGTEVLADAVDVNFTSGFDLTDAGGGQVTVDMNLGEKTSDDLPEGSTNQYFTDERAQDAAAAMITGGTNITTNYDDGTDTFTVNAADEDIQDAIYNNVLSGTQTLISVTYDDANNDVDYVVNDDLSLYDNSTSAFITGVATEDDGVSINTNIQTLNFGSNLSVTDDGGGQVTVDGTDTRTNVSDSGTQVVTNTTDINFGTNLGVTDDGDGSVTIAGTDTQLSDEQVQDAVYNNVLSGTQTRITVTYDDPNNEVDYVVDDDLANYSFANVTTDDISEGTTNLYYTDERVDDRVNNLLIGGNNINLTYDDGANSLTIDTTDVTVDVSEDGGTVVADVGDINFTSGFDVVDDTDGTVTVNMNLNEQSTDSLTEGTTNLYYLDSRVDSLIADGTGITTSFTQNDPASGTLTINSNLTPFTTDDLTEGTTNLYFTDERAQDAALSVVSGSQGITWTYDDAGNAATVTLDNLNSFTTDDLGEGSTNLYFTDARAISAVENEATLDLTGNLTVAGTFGLASGTTVNNIKTTIDAVSDDALVTEGAIIDQQYVRELDTIFSRTTISADSNTGTDTFYSVDTSGGVVTLTIRTADATEGRFISVKRNGINNAVIETEGTATIDDGTSATIEQDNEAVTLIYNSQNDDWEIR